MDRRRHRDRAGGQSRHRGPGPHALGRGRAGRRELPQAARRSSRRRLDGQQEARLVALTYSAPPEGHQRWRVRLLADRLVALQVVESVS